MYDFSQEFPKALATVIVLSIVGWLGGKLRKGQGLDGELRKPEKGTFTKEYPFSPSEEKKKTESMGHWLHWLLWWKIEPEELQKNIVEYDTLRIYQSARGISFLLLLSSGTLNIILICVGYDAWALVDAIVCFGLAAFIYRGHRWAMLLAMAFWTFEKAIQIYRIANMPELQGSGYLVVANLIWWAVYMHAFYLSFIVEKKRSIWTAAASALVPTSALIPAISTAQVPTPPPQARSQAPSAGIDPVMLAKANGGNAVSQRLVGRAYEKGEDYAHTGSSYRKAADQGNEDAQYNLGVAYALGIGVPQDHAQAVTWFRKAAEQGDASAQYTVGLAYARGHGVPQDYAEAYFWLDLGAVGKPGNVKQQEEFAKERDEAASHLSNTVLLQTQERARKWFEDHPTKPQ